MNPDFKPLFQRKILQDKVSGKKTQSRDQFKNSYEYLFSKAYDTQLTTDEINEVVKTLERYLQKPEQNPSDTQELCKLLQTLGFIGAFTGIKSEYRYLIEKFLYYSQDLNAPDTALSVLCIDWDMRNDYKTQIETFMKGIPWDNGQLRVTGFFQAGELLRTHPEQRLLDYLLSVVDNQDEELENRKAAFKALARGLGLDWDEIDKFLNLNDFQDNVIVKEIIEKARDLFDSD